MLCCVVLVLGSVVVSCCLVLSCLALSCLALSGLVLYIKFRKYWAAPPLEFYVHSSTVPVLTFERPSFKLVRQTPVVYRRRGGGR